MEEITGPFLIFSGRLVVEWKESRNYATITQSSVRCHAGGQENKHRLRRSGNCELPGGLLLWVIYLLLHLQYRGRRH